MHGMVMVFNRGKALLFTIPGSGVWHGMGGVGIGALDTMAFIE